MAYKSEAIFKVWIQETTHLKKNHTPTIVLVSGDIFLTPIVYCQMKVNFSLFFFNSHLSICLLILEREKEKDICEREISIGCLP